MPTYDLIESSVNVAIVSPLYDQTDVEFILDDNTDTVTFRWSFQGDPSPARTGSAEIVNSPSHIVRYSFLSGDLDQEGLLIGQFIINAPGKPFNGPTEPIELEIGPLVGP